MPVVSDEYKFIFFCVPLTGSTSVSHTLVESGLGEWAPKRDLRDENGKVLVDKKHGTLSQLRKCQLLPEEKISSYFKIASIRSPYDKVLSDYQEMYNDEARHLIESIYGEVIEHFGYKF